MMKACVWRSLVGPIVLAGLCVRPAHAATEFCPATLMGPWTNTQSKIAAVQYYRLHALGPRSVEATVIAETDQGWFTWQQPEVELTRTTYTTSGPRLSYRYGMAESPDLTVTFPAPVKVEHAWVVAATAHDDTLFGWDAHGRTTCDPPDFAEPAYKSQWTTKHTPLHSDPTPAPAPPPAVAVATAAPFPAATCQRPFAAAYVKHAIQPIFPSSLRDDMFNQEATVIVYVAIDRNGSLADAWIFVTSGYKALDRSALIAAQQSTYIAPISFCKPVSGSYLFRAEFMPN
jgi:TonB family protein